MFVGMVINWRWPRIRTWESCLDQLLPSSMGTSVISPSPYAKAEKSMIRQNVQDVTLLPSGTRY